MSISDWRCEKGSRSFDGGGGGCEGAVALTVGNPGIRLKVKTLKERVTGCSKSVFKEVQFGDSDMRL